MSNETSKQMQRRSVDHRFATRWIRGDGIDIGCGPDPLSNFSEYFPLMKSLRPWDLPDGDAMLMAGVADDSFEFVHSSHCLEHLVDPELALKNWVRICKPAGHLIITIPEEDLYEQGVWPSTFNSDHKWTFTIHKRSSWSPKSINVTSLLEKFTDQVEIIKIEKLDAGYRYNQPRYDQTLGSMGECAIEIILKKHARQNSERFDVEAAFARAVDLHRHGRGSEALEHYRTILNVDPGHLSALNNASLLVEPAEAEILLQRALSIDPDHVDAIINSGSRLMARGQAADAVRKFSRALELAPGSLMAINGLVQAHQDLGEHALALQALDLKLAAGQDHADIYYQKAVLHESMNDTEGAIACCDRALQLDPQHLRAHIWRGRQYMKKGDFLKGAQGFAWMWRGRIEQDPIGLFVDAAGHPMRQDGKLIVLCADAGLGDAIQFVRYAQRLNELGAKVVVECQAPLIKLLKNCSFIEQVFPSGECPLPFDLRLPMHNLIGAFRSTPDTIPCPIPYIQPNESVRTHFRQRMGEFAGPNIGLCWYGNKDLPRDASRSLQLAQALDIVSAQGLTFHSLHQEPTPVAGMVDWSADLVDIESTAALVGCMDLVISVDSMVAHLAGAMGQTVWLLNRFDSCWRWLEFRDDSPWYPTLTQFRQVAPNDWGYPLKALTAKLQTFRPQVTG